MSGGPPTGEGHRRDIDGLRALSVIAVVLYHFHLGPAPSGFLGVDVFFVLSGYLVSRMLLRDEGGPDIAGFLLRRTRRIVPALLVVVAATVLAAALLMVPPGFRDTASSAAAALGFVSNFWFWKNVDYFSGATGLYPLLHTWSLGVEWQYYLALPLLLLAYARFGDPRGASFRRLFAVMMAASLVLDLALAPGKPTGSFYFPATRFWELMAGSLLALQPTRPRLAPAVWSLAGLVALVALVATFAVPAGFLGPAGVPALPVVIATLVLLAAGERSDGWAPRILSWPAFTGIGLMSYSIYLWHWPLTVFYSYVVLRPTGPADAVVVTALSFGLAALTYRHVEEPCRRPGGVRALLVGRAGRVAAMAGLAMAVSVVVADRHETALRRDYAAYLGFLDPAYRDRVLATYGDGQCFLHHDGAKSLPASCLDAGAGAPRIALIGDSYAAHLLPGLKAALPGAAIAQATVTGCRVLTGHATAAGPVCPAMRDAVLARYGGGDRPDMVIVAGRWAEADLGALPATLAILVAAGQNVVVVGPPVEYADALPSLLIRLDQSNVAPAGLDRLRLSSVFAVDRAMRRIAAEAGVHYLSSVDGNCPSGRCAVFAEAGVPFTWDNGHYTPEGSVAMVRHFLPALQAYLPAADGERQAGLAVQR